MALLRILTHASVEMIVKEAAVPNPGVWLRQDQSREGARIVEHRMSILEPRIFGYFLQENYYNGPQYAEPIKLGFREDLEILRVEDVNQ